MTHSPDQAIFITEQLAKFKKQHILVLGDFILDAYVHGSAARVCPEAPVPVVDANSKKYILGGAANTARNLKHLGAKADLCTVIGNDYTGSRGYQLLKEAGIGHEGIYVQKNKKTQYKTRIMAEEQMLIRLDRGDKRPPGPEICEKLRSFLWKAVPGYSGIILADYDKGFFSPDIIEVLGALRKTFDFFLAVDSKRLATFRSLSPDLVKPNRQEAIALLKAGGATSADIQSSFSPDGDFKLGDDLQAITGSRLTALTLDQKGAVWLEKGQPICSQPAEKTGQGHLQVSGAGDSYIAAAVLSLGAGFEPAMAAKIAAKAASLVIAKEDTATCDLSELVTSFTDNQKLLSGRKAISEKVKMAREQHQAIVLTNGCYDILHNGHIDFLKTSAHLGDILIVAINIDEDITRIKGQGRPINGLRERITLLSALSFVDYIIPFGGNDYPSITEIISLIQPRLFTKGENYRYKIMQEQAALKKKQIPLVFIPVTTNKSTGQIIKKIQSQGKSTATPASAASATG